MKYFVHSYKVSFALTVKQKPELFVCDAIPAFYPQNQIQKICYAFYGCTRSLGKRGTVIPSG